MTFIILLLIILIFAFLLIKWSRIYLTWELKKASHHNRLIISVYIYKCRVIRRKWTYSSINFKSFVTRDIKIENLKEDWTNNLTFIKKIRPHLLTVQIHSFQWSTTIGTGRAHHTALCTGMLLSIKQIILSFLQQNLIFNVRPAVTVNPDFAQTNLAIELKGTASLKMKTALYVLIQIMRHHKKKKG